MEASPRAAAQALQLGAIASLTEVDIGEMLAVLPLLEPLLTQELRVALRVEGGELAVTAPILAPAAPSIARLDAALIGSARPLSTVLAASAGGACELELGSTRDPRGVAAAVRVIGERELADDLATAAALGIAGATCVALADQLAHLPDPRGGLVARVTAGALEVELGRVVPATDATRDAVLAAIAAIAAAVGVSTHQRTLIAQIHPVLARGQGALVALTATARGLAPRMSIRYAPMPWDTALRFATGLYLGDTATRLGRFAGAVGGEQVAWLDLILGPSEPPVAWIAAAQRPPTNHRA